MRFLYYFFSFSVVLRLFFMKVLYVLYFLYIFSFFKRLKNSELDTHGLVAGERDCVGKAWGLYRLSRGNSSQGQTWDRKKQSMRCKRESELYCHNY